MKKKHMLSKEGEGKVLLAYYQLQSQGIDVELGGLIDAVKDCLYRKCPNLFN